MWLSLVERVVRDDEVASSNLVTPTKRKNRAKALFFLFICVSDSSFANLLARFSLCYLYSQLNLGEKPVQNLVTPTILERKY